MNTLGLVLIALALLYLLAAFFCCAETAFTAVNRIWLREQAEQGNKNAILAKSLVEDSSCFFATVLMGTNLVHVTITTVFRLMVATILVRTVVFKWIAEWLGVQEDLDSLATSLIVTPTLLVFSELIPKALGRNHSEKLTMLLARPVEFSRIVFKPCVCIIGWCSDKITKLLGVAVDSNNLGAVSREDIKILAGVAAEQGLIRKESGQIMTSILEFGRKPVESLMVPLIEVKSISVHATVEELEQLAAETGFTRFPVYNKRVDDVIGLISLRRCIYERSLHEDDEEKIARMPILTLVDRNVMFVPESQTAGTLLAELHRSNSSMSVVVDEYGGVTGVITIEDLLETFIGGVQDLRNQETATIRRLNANSFICDGKTDIRDIEELLGFNIDNQGYETAAGLALKLFGRIPRLKESVNYHNYSITVLKMGQHRILSLLFRKIKG